MRSIAIAPCALAVAAAITAAPPAAAALRALGLNAATASHAATFTPSQTLPQLQLQPQPQPPAVSSPSHRCVRTSPARMSSTMVSTDTEVIVTGASILISGPSQAELYEAYADLARMTEWSPLLEAVVFDPLTRESSWALRVPRPLRFLARAAGFGDIAIRWRAVNVEESPPSLLRWRSLSGMENTGSARFEETVAGAVNMTLSIAYPMPESVRWFGESEVVQRFVRRTMLRTMRRFQEKMEAPYAPDDADP